MYRLFPLTCLKRKMMRIVTLTTVRPRPGRPPIDGLGKLESQHPETIFIVHYLDALVSHYFPALVVSKNSADNTVADDDSDVLYEASGCFVGSTTSAAVLQHGFHILQSKTSKSVPLPWPSMVWKFPWPRTDDSAHPIAGPLTS